VEVDVLKAPKRQEKRRNSASRLYLAVSWNSKWYSARRFWFYMQQNKFET